ncbi:MAG: Zn-ribbon domain-containing OB-fold protein [Rugosibacter sp.]
MQDAQQLFTGPGPDAIFAAALDEGKFLIQHCNACSKHVFYPRVICPHCGSPDLAWQPASGRGAVYATTVVRRKPEHGGDYNVALVDLAEGPRLMSRVDGVSPHDVRIGMAVVAQVIDEPKKGKLLVFVPVNGEKA